MVRERSRLRQASMRRFAAAVAPRAMATAFAALLALPAAVQAEPYMAVRTGLTCSSCHTDPTGGGKRNRYGMVWEQTDLPLHIVSSGDLDRMGGWLRKNLEDPVPAPGEGTDGGGETASSPPSWSTFTDGYLTSFLSVGTDLRFG